MKKKKENCNQLYSDEEQFRQITYHVESQIELQLFFVERDFTEDSSALQWKSFLVAENWTFKFFWCPRPQSAQ